MACVVLGSGSRTRSTYLLNLACAADLHFLASVVSKLRHGAILPPMHHKQYRLVVHLSWVFFCTLVGAGGLCVLHSCWMGCSLIVQQRMSVRK